MADFFIVMIKRWNQLYQPSILNEYDWTATEQYDNHSIDEMIAHIISQDTYSLQGSEEEFDY